MKHPDKTWFSGAVQVARKWKNARGILHRLGGPAIEWEDGQKMWVWNGRPIYFEGCIRYKGKNGRIWVDVEGKARFWAPGYSKPRRRSQK